jgi:putative transcriptional regulator
MSAARKFLKGQLLLDSGQLTGSFFQRTVVLICQHDAEGAFGLVLNKTSGSTVEDVLLADLPESVKNSQLYLGGPVQPTALSYLMLDSKRADSNVIPRVSLGHSLEGLDESVNVEELAGKIRLFAGYAGWSAGQLEDEIEREAWVTHPASAELVFNKSAETLWQHVLRSKGWQYRILAQMPEDPSYN